MQLSLKFYEVHSTCDYAMAFTMYGILFQKQYLKCLFILPSTLTGTLAVTSMFEKIHVRYKMDVYCM